MKTKTSTIDKEEVEQFSRIADEWWSPSGKFKPLHDINPLRIKWILDQLAPQKDHKKQPLQGMNLLDIGCGGGLICEPMAELGAKVVGLDASEKNISVAKLHAEQSSLEVDYRCMAAEDLAETGEKFDVVLALEILEHVANLPVFIEAACKLAKPGGVVIMSTLNRTFKSYAFAIIGAEYVLRLLPRGTHHWNKFIKPSELCGQLQKNNVSISKMTGMVMNPLTWEWELKTKDLDVNYLVCGKKQ